MTTQLRKRITEALTENGIDPSDKLLTDLERATKPSRTITAQQSAVSALLAVTGWGLPMYVRAARLVKALASGCDYAEVAADLESHYGDKPNSGWWWYRNDWRGIKSQRPDESGIRQTWKFWEKKDVQVASEPAGWAGLREWASENGVVLDGQD